MNKISFSQWTTWAKCPLWWKNKYVIGPRIDDSSIDTVFGTTMHEVIQDWLTDVFGKSEAYANKQDLTDKIRATLIKLFTENTTKTDDGQTVYLCDKTTLMEYYTHGCLIMDYLQTHRAKIFPTKNVTLVGIEVELAVEVKNNVLFKGFIDIVTKDEETGRVTIYDLKTSKSGWGDWQKKDKLKTHQLLLYKKFYSKQYDVPENMIDVQFVILKRMIVESDLYHIPRIGKFIPANGKPSVNKAVADIEHFIDECFNPDGSYKDIEAVPTPSKSNCRFCSYKTDKEKCPVGIS